MKKIALAAALTGIAGSATSVLASDGELKVTGMLTTSTCTVGGGDSVTAGNPNIINVDLTPVPAVSLNAVGKTAGNENFDIKLLAANGTDVCDKATLDKVAGIFFEAGAGVDSATGLLKNVSTDPGKANFVGVALYQSDGATRIIPGTPGAGNQDFITTGQGAGVLKYALAYYATGQATAGPILAGTTFSIAYK